jgi:hypothetical protein
MSSLFCSRLSGGTPSQGGADDPSACTIAGIGVQSATLLVRVEANSPQQIDKDRRIARLRERACESDLEWQLPEPIPVAPHRSFDGVHPYLSAHSTPGSSDAWLYLDHGRTVCAFLTLVAAFIIVASATFITRRLLPGAGEGWLFRLAWPAVVAVFAGILALQHPPVVDALATSGR